METIPHYVFVKERRSEDAQHLLTLWLEVRLRSHERRNELIPAWNFKPAWKQVLSTWRFISAAFQNDPIFWWTCVGISFWVVFTWYVITQNEISFLSKWPQWNSTHNEFQTHMRIKRNIQRVCAYSFRFGIWKPRAGLKFHFGQNDRYKIHTGLSFILPQFMWTQVKSWLNTEVRFSTEMKSIPESYNEFLDSYIFNLLKCLFKIFPGGHFWHHT